MDLKKNSKLNKKLMSWISKSACCHQIDKCKQSINKIVPLWLNDSMNNWEKQKNLNTYIHKTYKCFYKATCGTNGGRFLKIAQATKKIS